MTHLTQRLYLLEPQYRERVWGGSSLKVQDPPIGEAWIAFEGSRVREGPHVGQTVAQLADRYGPALLGEEVALAFARRFPLLVKLLDCADWLSVQVHPNDEQAERLVGKGEFGKTEAWHFLEAKPGATILAGVRPGTTEEELAAAIRTEHILDVAQSREVHAGETYLLHAGTLHALGPGLLLYEIQQVSDTTYRVYDWGRPASMGRKLHLEESVAVTDSRKTVIPTPPPVLHGTSASLVTKCEFFLLEALQIADSALTADTQGRAFHIITVKAGKIRITCEDETAELGRFETALIAGHAGEYQVEALDEMAALLRAAVPAIRSEG